MAAGTQADANLNYVAMLLSGDGTNGAQNNTFIDSSTNNFTMTRIGSTTQGSLSPYGTLRSAYFDGSGDSLSVSSPATALREWWTSDFTIEAWIFPTTFTGWSYTDGSERPTLCGNASLSTTTHLWSFGPISTGAVVFCYNNGSAVYVTSTATVTANQWNHIAMTKTSSGIVIWVNGVGTSATAISGTPTSSSASPLAIGQINNTTVTGYVSNLRIVNGTAVYSSTFTPSAAPLTAVTNTSLLACNSNQFKDSSSNNYSLVLAGNPRVSRASPFAPSAAYTTTESGASGYFPGSGHCVDVSSSSGSASFTFGTGDVTIEAWVYHTTVSGYQNYYRTQGTGANAAYLFRTNGTALEWIVNSGTGTTLLNMVTSSGAIRANEWTHVAAVRNGSSNKIYVNGVEKASTTASYDAPAPQGTVGIGRGNFTTGENLSGYLSNLRVAKSAVYTAAFTPPSAQLTAITGTQLLLKFENAGIFDSVAQTIVETVGNAQISTSVKKNGTGSLAFDGTGDWLIAPDSPFLQLGTAPFAIEAWVYLSATGSARGLLAKGGAATGWLLSTNTSDQVVFTHGSTAITTTAALTATTWHHIAAVRTGTGTNGFSIYINGTAAATSTVSTSFTQTESLYVGADRAAGSAMSGYMDDVRITNGVAAIKDPYFNNVSLLMHMDGSNGGTSFTDSSRYSHSVTAFGNAQTSTAQSKFGGASLLGDASGDYLSVPSNDALDLTGDFTIEYWFYSLSSNEQAHLRKANSGGFGPYGLTLNTSDKILVLLATTSNSWNTVGTSTNAFTKNAWHHVALTRSGNNFKLFVDGALEWSSTLAITLLQNTDPLLIGYSRYTPIPSYLDGYIDELRITKGVARYTGAFTPSAEAFLNK